MNTLYDVTHLGQVFTPDFIVDQMIALRRNNGTVLEPSCGDGAFSSRFADCTAIELDPGKAPENALRMDFFDYSLDHTFDTVIGNPPYVRYQDIPPDTKKKLDLSRFDNRSSLYLFFIEKCVKHLNPHGELIFIVPRDFLKSTSSAKLNQWLYDNGTITDFFDLGGQRIFEDACPDCAIFRYERNDFSHVTNGNRTFSVVNGQILFTPASYYIPFSNIFFVKVGAATGANDVFISENGNQEFVCSATRQTGKTVRMFYGVPAPDLLPYKDRLLSRKLKRFDESNWYEYGRDYYHSDSPRIYVNAKTRVDDPFFVCDCKAYDGSVLGIFPKRDFNLNEAVADLNAVNWEELGFKSGGRFLFTQKALEGCLLPGSFSKYL